MAHDDADFLAGPGAPDGRDPGLVPALRRIDASNRRVAARLGDLEKAIVRGIGILEGLLRGAGGAPARGPGADASAARLGTSLAALDRALDGTRGEIEALSVGQESFNDSLGRSVRSAETLEESVGGVGAALEDAAVPGAARLSDTIETRLTPAARRLEGAARDVGDRLSSAFEAAIVDGRGLREVLAGVLDDLRRIVLEAANAEIGGGGGSFLSDLFGGLFGGGGGAPFGLGGGATPFGIGGGSFLTSASGGSFGVPTTAAVGLHSGGVAGRNAAFTRLVPEALIALAPRFAGGGVAGLRADEVPAILHRGEIVRTPGQEAALARRLEGGPRTVFNIDARGADREGLRILARAIGRLDASVEPRAVAAVMRARGRGPGF